MPAPESRKRIRLPFLTRKPVVVDTTLHLAFTVGYAILVITGILAAFALPPSLEIVGGREVTVLWIIGLGVTSALSLAFSLKEKWQRREMVSTSLLLCLLVIYPLAVLISAINAGNQDRVVLASLTLFLSVFPAWRVQYIYRKYRKPKNG